MLRHLALLPLVTRTKIWFAFEKLGEETGHRNYYNRSGSYSDSHDPNTHHLRKFLKIFREKIYSSHFILNNDATDVKAFSKLKFNNKKTRYSTFRIRKRFVGPPWSGSPSFVPVP